MGSTVQVQQSKCYWWWQSWYWQLVGGETPPQYLATKVVDAFKFATYEKHDWWLTGIHVSKQLNLSVSQWNTPYIINNHNIYTYRMEGVLIQVQSCNSSTRHCDDWASLLASVELVQINLMFYLGMVRIITEKKIQGLSRTNYTFQGLR